MNSAPPISKRYVLECRRGPLVHYIPIPRPSRVEINSSLPAITTDTKKLLVACPECGLVSAYSAADVQVHLSPTHDPFERGIRRLVSIAVECDHEGCEAQALVHTVLENDGGTWTQKSLPRSWKFSSDCRCKSGHPLAPQWDNDHYAWERSDPLF